MTQTESFVEVRYRTEGREELARARFVAGCDGARSKVREVLGASLEGMTYKTRVALADITLRGMNNLPFPRLTTSPELAIGIRINPDLWRLILPLLESSKYDDLEKRIAATAPSLFNGTGYTITWLSEFRIHRRISSRWTAGRIVLAGDAAHLNSPVGGQGMNAGIMDAHALTGALVRALEADNPQPLAHYAEKRKRTIEQGVNRFTDRLTRLLLGGSGRLIRPVIKSASLALKLGPFRRRVLRRLAMLNQA